MWSASVVGASGYAGGELLRLLLGHESVSIHQATSESFAGKPLARAHPHLRGLTDLRFESVGALTPADILFCCLPHGLAAAKWSSLAPLAERIVDLSSDFRLRDPSVYQRYYGRPHAGLRTRVDTWGPPPLERMTKLFFEMNAVDVEARIATEGRVPLAPLVHVHELEKGGVVLDDENVKVMAALVDHPPLVPAFAYRFDAPDRSIVISGDTKRSDNLVELARGADVLVHSALYLPALDRLVARVGNAPGLKESILSLQAPVADAARVAEAAGVKALVLSHLIPPDDPEVTEEMWLDAARAHFRGSIVVGKDLMEI